MPRQLIEPRRGARAVRSASVAVAILALIAGLFSAGAATAAERPAASRASAAAPAAPAAVGTGGLVRATLAGFTPGNIISDAVFSHSGSMNESQIQSFLNGKVSTCRSGYVCLKNFRQSTYTRPASPMCGGAYTGEANESAARIVAKVGQACGVNPQVLLTMLQKEQGLVTHTWPSDWRYTIAMGQGCPDTAACDTRYYGFFNQVYGAASQLKRYANPPGTSQFFTWYAPGKTWNVRYHPNVSCGSSPVYIANQATAALYYYTPYQPNAAALAAGYGLANNACSSYGNRNFYNYFTDWFGSTQGETLQVLQVAGTGQRYLVSNGSRWRLSTAEMAAQFTWISTVREVSQADINAYQDRGTAKRAVRTEDGIVWVLDSGQRLRVRDVAQVADFGWDYGALPAAGASQVNRYRDGGWLERVVRSEGISSLIQSASRRQILDLGLLPRYGIPALSTEVSAGMAAEYPTASPVVGPGVYRDAKNPYRVLTDAGVYLVPDAASGTAVARSARELSGDSFAHLRTSTTMPVRMVSAGKSYVLLEDGWLEVSDAKYPAALSFSKLPNGAAAGIANAGRVTGPHFLRERSDAQVYLVSWGTIQPVSSAEQLWVTRTYGVSPRVWVGLDGTIGDGAAATEGLVRTEAGSAYLLDGARAYRLRDCDHVAAWGGNCATLPIVDDLNLAAYVNAGAIQALVRTPAGTTWLPQGGRLRQVLDPGILAIYGIPSSTSPISTATAEKLPVGEPALNAGIYSDGADARIVVTEGGEYTLTGEQVVGVMHTSSRALTSSSFAQIVVEGRLPSRMRSDGRSFVLTQEGWLEVSAAAYGGDGVFTALPSGAWKGIVVAANEQRPHFVRDEASATEYLISAGAAQPVSGAAERGSISAVYGVPPRVWALAGGALTGVQMSYDLIARGASGDVYLIDGDTRYRMSGCSVAHEFGKDCANMRVLTPAQLASTRDGGALSTLLRSPDGIVWLPQSGSRREVPDPGILSVYGIGTAATSVSPQVLSHLRLGPPVAGVGAYDDRAGDVRVITGDGRIFAVPASSRIGTVTSRAWMISPASLDLLTVEGDLPTRINTGSQMYVLTGEGWLAVNATAYAPLTFASVGARAAEGLPSAGSQPGPHFVREQSSSRMYLASGGLTAVADEAARAWIASAYGVPGKVWVVADGTLR